MALQVPNQSFPLTMNDGIITQAWQIFLTNIITTVNTAVSNITTLQGQIVPSQGAIIYQGAAAPSGWTQITTAGLPTIPAGFIWIQKN